MIEGHRVIALVPARGGSVTVKDKNLRSLGGRPLLAWPIETALATPQIDRVIVSTDAESIAAEARTRGAEVYERPAHLATNDAAVVDTVRHLRAVLREEGETAEILVLLEATSPFRTPDLVSRCLARLVAEHLDSIGTFHEATTNPERAWRIEAGLPRPFIAGANPWQRRQQLPPAYELNGAVYALWFDRLPRESDGILYGTIGAEIVAAGEVIDIDDERDFAVADAIFESRGRSDAP